MNLESHQIMFNHHCQLEIRYICTSYATILNGCHEIFNESLEFYRFNPDP